MNRKNEKNLGLVTGLLTTGLLLAVAVLLLRPISAKACITPSGCDFLTGGGWIVYNGAKANFGVGGGCKHGSPTWGHLEYHDHGAGLDVHWTAITAYIDQGTDDGTDSHGQPTGTRFICGTARTNQYGDVNFVVRARDAGEPGVNDQFDIQLQNQTTGSIVYTTVNNCAPHYLGSYACSMPGDGGGGNIQLHKPNPSTSGSFGGSCPAY